MGEDQTHHARALCTAPALSCLRLNHIVSAAALADMAWSIVSTTGLGNMARGIISCFVQSQVCGAFVLYGTRPTAHLAPRLSSVAA
jgi:hypothetical protein